jgi:two-component sensor histidine kinase
MHELATNALKYGALKSPGGKVSITWSAAPEGEGTRLRLEWRETGGAPLKPNAARPNAARPNAARPNSGKPKRQGFGTRVIRAAVAREREGKSEIAFEPDGLVCRFEFIAEADPQPTRDDAA